jgi:iron-sulfur cluster insertion protein
MAEAVILTDSARRHMEGLITKQGKPIVRLQVKGGGCAGFQYEWEMSDAKEAEDEVIALANGEFAIDSQSLLFIMGTTVDYVEEVFGSSLQIKNPNSKASCGCGESFAV